MNLAGHKRVHVDEDLESKYEIFDQLGGGGMGRVLRARHRQLRRPVAIKLLQQDLQSEESVRRFIREARAAAQIRSTHVAQVMDAGILRNGQPYIVMEYLEGQDLAQLLKSRGRLPIEQGVSFVLQALDALAEAHSLGIVHRDIKPGNLFATRGVDGETSIKVVDFGLAKSSLAADTIDPGVTERGAVLGTPSYMAPEQFVNAQDADARADIWGVGATLFELLTGVPPFTGTTLPQIYTAVMHQEVPAIRSVVTELPAELESVVARCLTRDRCERYAHVGELADALQPFAAESAREHVDRIRRVLKGAIDSGDRAALASFERECVQVDERGAVSSTFHRNPIGGVIAPTPGTRPQPTRRRAVTLAAVGAVVSLAAAGWGWSSVTREAAAEPKQVAKPPVEVKAEPALTPPPPEPPSEAPAVVVSTQAAEVPAATPPPSVSRPTANRRRRANVNSNAGKPPVTSIYEQYP